MKILITGANGFIGKYVIDILNKNYNNLEIIALSSKKINGITTLLHNNYSFEKDYFCKEGHSDIEILLHMGSYTPKNVKEVDDIEYCSSNILNTKKLLLSNLPNLRKIIFTSAIDVYGINDDKINENSAINPISLYGYSKLFCEKMITQYCLNKNIVSQILRVGHTYGAGEEKYKKLIPTILQRISKNEEITVYGDGSETRSYMFVKDVAISICNALFLDESFGVINVVSEDAKSINDILGIIMSVSNRKVIINYVPSEKKNRNLRFDNSKLKEYLMVTFTSFEEGIKQEIEHLENRDENIL